MTPARTLYLRRSGRAVRVRDTFEVNADECRFCPMKPVNAVAELRRLLSARQAVTVCSDCGDAMAGEIARQMKPRRSS